MTDTTTTTQPTIETAEQPPAEAPPKRKRGVPGKKRRVPGSKRPPARPHRKVPQETLLSRIAKLTARVDRTRRQHDAAQILLTKYSKEKVYREEDAIKQASQTEETPATEQA